MHTPPAWIPEGQQGNAVDWPSPPPAAVRCDGHGAGDRRWKKKIREKRVRIGGRHRGC